ncbi:hypothetical protein HRG_004763 [Hirsutella rhossiliensis]|uniref:Uncharacterized protein n=1 Tax=Hirsutella rhossiliensis TaxID=111463 RepID=A0A9P8MZY6_9HYPO|nr:uncharacterized protein HRG_04763 [Hirsutella rhossiliensis]KAH0964335.1 hypothetical protein HRG_04763 [Hirsutella rhossiliensis]
MNSTPVRIRGKRKPSSSTAKRPSPAPPAPKKMKRPLASVLASRSTRRRPTLESLPGEVLETVLLYSCNIALPRASPLLGVKLSDRVTLLRLFIWAFHDTWEQWFGIPQSQSFHHVPRSAREYEVPCQGDPVLQSAMLELPWVNIDFILQAQQAWADRYARGRWYQHSVPWRGDSRELPHDHRGGFGHFDARTCFEADYQQALRTHLRFEESRQWRARDVHPHTRMPAQLIVGPWDEEKLRRLFWLTRGGIRMDEDLRSLPPWEMRLQCLDNAVISAPEPSALVVNCMMGTWTFVNLPRDAVTKALANLDKRLEWGGDSRESRVVLRWARSSLSLSLGLSDYPGPIGRWAAH